MQFTLFVPRPPFKHNKLVAGIIASTTPVISSKWIGSLGAAALARSAHSHYPPLFDHRARNNN
jgi:hypothetical protein